MERLWAVFEVCRKSRIIMRYNFVHTSYVQESIILTLAVGLAVDGAFVGSDVGLAVDGALVGFAVGLAVEGAFVGCN